MSDYTRYRSQLIPYIICCFLCFILKIINIFDFGKYNEERNVSSRYYSEEHSPNILSTWVGAPGHYNSSLKKKFFNYIKLY